MSEHRVGAPAPRPLQDRLGRVVARFEQGQRTGLAGPVGLELGDVDAGDVAARGLGQPDGQLADQAQPDHDDLARRARPRPAAAPCSATDATVAKAASAAGTPAGHRRAQQPRDGLELGVVGLPGAAGGHQLAGRDAGHRLAHLQGDAGAPSTRGGRRRRGGPAPSGRSWRSRRSGPS